MNEHMGKPMLSRRQELNTIAVGAQNFPLLKSNAITSIASHSPLALFCSQNPIKQIVD